MACSRHLGTLCAWLAVGVLLGCGATKNYDERESVADPGDPNCIYTCQPPVESRLLSAEECAAAEEGLELLPIWDFEGGMATSMYQYDDSTTTFREPVEGWQPTTVNVERCEHDTSVLNVRGGPFRAWGGGMGSQIEQLRSSNVTSWGGCFGVETDRDICPSPSAEFSGRIIDLTQWEGIALWARRGIDSQPGFRVMVGDKYTDDDLSFVSYATDPDPEVAAELGAPRNCERVKECGCRNHKPCTETDFPDPNPEEGNRTYCWDPDADPPLITVDGDNALDAEGHEYPICGRSSCVAPYAAYEGNPIGTYDAQFADSGACEDYTFRTGFFGKYCWDPGDDPQPAETSQRCGDHWLAPVRLTTDWAFYKVPFKEMLQQGWAKEVPKLDLAAVSVVRITYDKGWIDFWIDDVSFYRRAKN